jgi:glycine/D-amino acid oxidase-like deaminating enzyme
VTAKGKIKAPSQKNGETTTDVVEEWKKLPKTSIKSKTIASELPDDLDWLDSESIRSYSEMGTPATTAQVHPYLFTTSIAELAAEKGAQIILGAVTGIDKSADGVKSVTYEDKTTKEVHTIPATDVVVSAGPWTNTVLPEAPIEALRAHSVVIKADVSPYAVFTDIELPKNYSASRKDVKKRKHGRSVNPEMYARPDGTVYACGKIWPDI